MLAQAYCLFYNVPDVFILVIMIIAGSVGLLNFSTARSWSLCLCMDLLEMIGKLRLPKKYKAKTIERVIGAPKLTYIDLEQRI